MTNTLHRYGKASSFQDDFILFCIPSPGKNDTGAVEKQKAFLRICARHNPSTWATATAGASGPSGVLIRGRTGTAITPRTGKA